MKKKPAMPISPTVFFFFSSRRRHTRYIGDWSSDVCSSDLVLRHRPLARVPENTLKYVVGLLLASFGTFWAVEGLGVFQSGGDSLGWPGDNWSLLGLLGAWFLLSRILIRLAPTVAAAGLPAVAEGAS